MVMLQLDRVSPRYGRRAILSGVSTPALEGGQVMALLGPNAAGKSTLFRRMFGLLRGAVRIARARSERPLGYMPQDTGTGAAPTAYEAVLLARMQGRGLIVAREELREVERTLDFLSIADLGPRDMADLSGGQKQLVSAALDLHRQVALLTILPPDRRGRRGLKLAAEPS